MYKKSSQLWRVYLVCLSVSLFFFSSWPPSLSVATAQGGSLTHSVSSPDSDWLLDVGLMMLVTVGVVMMAGANWLKGATADFWRNGRKRTNTWIDRLRPGQSGGTPPVQPPSQPQLPPPPKKKPAPVPENPAKPALPPPPKKRIPAGKKRRGRLPQAAWDVFTSTEPPTLDILEAWQKEYLKDGPLDAKDGLPWDEYDYPDMPKVPEEALQSYDNTEWVMKKIISWWGKWRDKDKKKPAPPDRQLPEGLTPAQIQMFEQGVDSTSAKNVVGQMANNDYVLALYNRWLKEAGIRHFTAEEITSHRWRKAWLPNKAIAEGASAWSALFLVLKPSSPLHFVLPKHVVPDPRLWPAILPHLIVLDRFRAWLEKPVTAFVGYRLPWYNAKISGSQNSFHMKNAAIDFLYGKRTEEGEIDASIFWRWFSALYRRPGDGVGAYPTFLHLDVGHGRSRGKWRRKAQRWVHAARRNKDNVFGGLSYSIVGKK